MKKILVLVVLAAIVQIPAAPPASAQGVASVPSRIEFEDVLRGSEIRRTVTVLNDTGQVRAMTVEVEGPAADWLTVTQVDGTPFPEEYLTQDDEEIPIRVILRVPTDAPNEPTTAEIVVSFEAPPNTEGVAIDLAVVVPVSMAVTGDQRLEGNFREFIVRDTELGLPVRMFVSLSNTGNVSVSPTLRVEIVAADGPREGEMIGEALSGRNELLPGESKSFGVNWPTENELPGTYIATAFVDYAGLDLGTREATFTVAPRGTLTRSGVLRSIELIGEPVFGGVTRAEVTFFNTGQIESRATFIGELSRDGTLVEVVQSLERLTFAGETVVLEVFLTTALAGDYVLSGKVNFEGTETEEMELAFEVVDPTVVDEGDGGLPLPAVIGGVAGGLALLALAFSWLRRRRSGSPKKRTDHDAPASAATGSGGRNAADTAAEARIDS